MATGRASLTVGDGDTALALGSGDVPVLATPRLVALVEAAAVDGLRGELGSGETSVGVLVELEHLAATPVGGRVEATARLVGREGRSLVFEVGARDGSGREVARGRHRRVVVDRERFLGSL